MKQQTLSLNHLALGATRANLSWFGLALSCALLAGLLPATASAQSITNYFTDGDGTDATPLDQYPSAPGAGWLEGWTSTLGTSAGLTAGVSNSAPLNGGGNYLNWKLGGGTAASTIRRRFDPVNSMGMEITKPYVVEFDYRVDVITAAGVPNFTSFSSASDYFSIEQLGETGQADVRGRATFWIKAQGATASGSPGLAAKFWSFFEGGLQGTTESRGLFINSTNVPLATNTVYHFRFDVDPIQRVYEGTVSDGVNTFNTTTATGRKLRWRNYTMASDAANLSNTTYMTFIGRNNTATETNVQSLDSLAIYQLNTNLWPVVLTQINPVKAQTFFPESGYLTSSNNIVYGETNLVFNAETFGTNRLPASAVQLTLNGVNVTGGLTFDGDDSTNNRTITYTGALKVNTVYEGNLTVADQAGRSTSLPFFFDTFSTNAGALIIETEHYNFDPALAYCSVLQIDGARPDRYIQNWLYGGVSALDPSGATNVVDSYFGRDSTQNIDFYTPYPQVPSDFRACSDAGTRKSPGDEYERPWIEATGCFEYINDKMTNGTWFNYTHEWPAGNYLVYLRAGAAFTNATFELGKVTSDYTQPNQTTNKLGTFILTNAPPRREILKNYLPTDSNGYTPLVHLSGKETLRLMVATGDLQDSTYLNRMVFVPAPAPVITGVSLSGSDLSFKLEPTVAGVQYSIKTNSTINAGLWSTMTTVTGNGGAVTVHHNPIGDGNLFYRAVSP